MAKIRKEIVDLIESEKQGLRDEIGADLLAKFPIGLDGLTPFAFNREYQIDVRPCSEGLWIASQRWSAPIPLDDRLYCDFLICRSGIPKEDFWRYEHHDDRSLQQVIIDQIEFVDVFMELHGIPRNPVGKFLWSIGQVFRRLF